jgi:ubiquitin-conjugating enzyme E2 variant
MWKSVAAGILMGDFLTAVVHWGEDTYLPYDKTQSMLGRISRDNEMHHFVPYSITTGSWWSNMEVSFKLMVGVALALVVAVPKWASKRRIFLLVTAATMVFSNLLHRFQHERDCMRPALATWLQRLGILCSREQHAVHHRDSVSNYGLFLGFTNPIYDGLGVWRFLERVLGFVGLPPSGRKKGVEGYMGLRDDWLRDNMARDCPEPLDKKRLQKYYRRLAKAHVEGYV